MCSAIAWKYRPGEYAVDGLNTLRYKLVATEPRPLYTWLLVTLPPHPAYFKSIIARVNFVTNVCVHCASEMSLFVTLLLLCLTTMLLPWRAKFTHCAQSVVDDECVCLPLSGASILRRHCAWYVIEILGRMKFLKMFLQTTAAWYQPDMTDPPPSVRCI